LNETSVWSQDQGLASFEDDGIINFHIPNISESQECLAMDLYTREYIPMNCNDAAEHLCRVPDEGLTYRLTHKSADNIDLETDYFLYSYAYGVRFLGFKGQNQVFLSNNNNHWYFYHESKKVFLIEKYLNSSAGIHQVSIIDESKNETILFTMRLSNVSTKVVFFFLFKIKIQNIKPIKVLV
jgi:hypothetical protein